MALFRFFTLDLIGLIIFNKIRDRLIGWIILNYVRDKQLAYWFGNILANIKDQYM